MQCLESELRNLEKSIGILSDSPCDQKAASNSQEKTTMTGARFLHKMKIINILNEVFYVNLRP